jgi:hypothetical protein
MTYTADPTTLIGQIRLRIADRNSVNPIFQDEDLEAFYAMEGDSLKRACAAALETIAINEALILKVITNQGLSTNGAALAQALNQSASRLREQALEDEALCGSTFEIIEQVIDGFTRREALRNARLRGS